MSKKPSKRIPSLDGIRGAAMMLVFLTHAQILWLYEVVGHPILLALGEIGLTAFFFMSGFIITTLLRKEYEQNGSLSFSKFYLRRVYRLGPPFFMTMLGIVPLVYFDILAVKWDWSNYIGQILQVGNYVWLLDDNLFMRATGTNLVWSLAVENHFYLLFPVMLLGLIRFGSYRLVAAVMLTICLLVLVWRWIAWFELELSRDWLRNATDTRIDSILYGCCMALWRNPAFDDEVKTYRESTGTITVITLLAIMVGAALCPIEAISVIAVYAIQCVCLYFIYMRAILHPEWACFRWLNSRPMVWIGTISYTVYLIHIVVLKTLRSVTEWNDVVVAISGLVLTLVLASLSFIYIEGPLARLRHKLH